LTLCGVEVFGEYLGKPSNQKDKKEEKHDDSKDVKLELISSSESGVDRRWPWHAKKLVES
jgi:hypothetical protein